MTPQDSHEMKIKLEQIYAEFRQQLDALKAKQLKILSDYADEQQDIKAKAAIKHISDIQP